ncbi:MAG: hypothetical protein AAF590_03245 [Pseudomonadota bacterium]
MVTLKSLAFFGYVFLVAHVSPAVSQSPILIFYQTGAELPFSTTDIEGVEYQGEAQLSVAIRLTPMMSERLEQFTQSVLGGQIMTVSQGRIVTADTVVRTALSGPVIRFGGSDAGKLQTIADGFEHALAIGGETPVFVTYHQTSTLELTAETILINEDRNGARVLSIHLPLDASDTSMLPTMETGWIAVVGDQVVQDWTISRDSDGLAVTLRDLSAEQRSLLD